MELDAKDMQILAVIAGTKKGSLRQIFRRIKGLSFTDFLNRVALLRSAGLVLWIERSSPFEISVQRRSLRIGWFNGLRYYYVLTDAGRADIKGLSIPPLD